jgi:hypothetical protein
LNFILIGFNLMTIHVINDQKLFGALLLRATVYIIYIRH